MRTPKELEDLKEGERKYLTGPGNMSLTIRKSKQKERDEQLVADVQRIAHETERTYAWVMRRALHDFVTRYDKMKQNSDARDAASGREHTPL
jgi:predicted transcriptional regulator